MKHIKTRFPPSPTGMVHVGNLRTALFSYLYARRHKGTFMLRIEDTDQTRYVPGAIENLISALEWAGISVDEGVMGVDQSGKLIYKGDAAPYVQSERLSIYQEYIQILLEKGDVYYAFDTKEELDAMRERQELNKMPTRYERETMNNQFTLGEEETKRRIDAGEQYVIRMKMPQSGTTTFTDVVRGEVSVENKEVDDQILMKSDGFPTYHFAVVVDDYLMGSTHVIRGEDWLSSTPKHVTLYKMFGWEIPVFAHLPLLINEQKQKLSKRNGDVSVEDFRKKGYLPQALINFIALLGWNPGTEQEIFTLKELEEVFDLDRVSKSSAVFNREKLNWYNQYYIRHLKTSELAELVKPYFVEAGIEIPEDAQWFESVIELEKERAVTLSDFPEALRFLLSDIEYDSDLLVWKKSTKADTKEKLTLVYAFLSELKDEMWVKKEDKAPVEEATLNWIKEQGFGNGDVLWPMRVALSGQKNSPGPFEIAAVLGREKSLERIEKAISFL